jgi:hypothetical protein
MYQRPGLSLLTKETSGLFCREPLSRNLNSRDGWQPLCCDTGRVKGILSEVL